MVESSVVVFDDVAAAHDTFSSAENGSIEGRDVAAAADVLDESWTECSAGCGSVEDDVC